MSKEFIPLSVPNICGNEWEYVKDCLDTGWITMGSYIDRFEQAVAEFTKSKYAVSVVNGTSALHIGLLLYGVEKGDYVIMPDITFVATANAIRYVGADPILIDTDLHTWQMDLDLLEEFLATQTYNKNGELFYAQDNRRIKLIMPVHVQGNMFDMERFIDLCSQFQVDFFEDSSEALGTSYKGRAAGTFSRLGVYSFNGNKIISTGGGGMIVTNNEALAKRAKHLTTQAKADSFEYIHDEVGYNYRLVNILAAIGLGQMEQLPGFIERKKEIVKKYKEALNGVGDISFQKITEGVEDNGWLFTIQTNFKKELIEHLNKKQIQSRPFWMPMHKLPMYRESIYFSKGQAEKVYNSCISIPSSTNLTDEYLERVIDSIHAYYKLNHVLVC